MNKQCFDELNRMLGRRGLRIASVSFALAARSGANVVAGGVPLCPKRGEGERCRKHRQCCSRQCQRKHGKRKGRCRCSALREPCATNGDCCGFQEGNLATPRCEFQAMSATRVCCKIRPGSCQSSADCCSTAVPCMDGVCGD